MGIFKKRQDPEPFEPASHFIPEGDPRLPGLAGYRRASLPAKESMPEIRFNYVRPDGKPDRKGRYAK